ncbi:hypothetical protein J7L27_06910 [Candidatus Bathyarchaeota archaeon]|nr:hypothetical protein [Candidatus Bathyarchaeota archaeon]
MEPLNLIYWIKMGLGAFVGVLCVLLKVNNIFSGIMISLAVYVISDRILRQIFIAKVSKPSEITKTGVSIYVTAWIFFWVLLYTLLMSA